MTSKEKESAAFRGLPSRIRILLFASPLWLAVILVFLSRTSKSFLEVVQFMTYSPLR